MFSYHLDNVGIPTCLHFRPNQPVRSVTRRKYQNAHVVKHAVATGDAESLDSLSG